MDETLELKTVTRKAWPLYFPEEQEEDFDIKDGRCAVASLFRSFFLSTGSWILNKYNLLRMDLTSIVVQYEDLKDQPGLDDFEICLSKNPEITIACMGLALFSIWADHLQILPPSKLTARITRADPFVPLSSLKANIVGRFISVTGTVVRVSGIRPLVVSCDFVCPKCSYVLTKGFVDGKFDPPVNCPNSPCRGRIFIPDRSTARTVDFQKIKIQEIDDDQADPGRIPRTLEVELMEDLVDTCTPGDIVTISGVVKTVNSEIHGGRNGKRAHANTLFILYLLANSVESSGSKVNDEISHKASDDTSTFTKEELVFINKVANLDLIFHRLVHSLCPGIFGNEIVKAGLVLGLFGGTNNSSNQSNMSPRSDSHIIIVGDPGMGKSQMLRAVSGLAPRSVYICGNTTTTTGLTVTMVKDSSGDFGLEAGALVLADQGICCIDEFDKMGIDYQALLEAMEQQSISIAKAGIVCNLSAKTSVIAAANPAGGHYNRSRSVSENLKMKAALLSRFDLIFVLLDRPDVRRDEVLSEHIMQVHASRRPSSNIGSKAQGNAREGIQHVLDDADDSTLSQRLRDTANEFSRNAIPSSMLKKYIAYAKKYVHPKLSVSAAKLLQRKYLEMRSAAGNNQEGVPITTRQLESLIRLAQARAKTELREVVTENDAKEVVEILQESLLDTFTDESGELDFGRSGGMSLAKKVKAFVAKLNKVVQRKNTIMFTFQDLLEIANSMGLQVDDFRDFVDILRNECYLLKKGPQLYKVQTSSYSMS